MTLHQLQVATTVDSTTTKNTTFQVVLISRESKQCLYDILPHLKHRTVAHRRKPSEQEASKLHKLTRNEGLRRYCQSRQYYKMRISLSTNGDRSAALACLNDLDIIQAHLSCYR